jgi:hypothetical protein
MAHHFLRRCLYSRLYCVQMATGLPPAIFALLLICKSHFAVSCGVREKTKNTISLFSRDVVKGALSINSTYT